MRWGVKGGGRRYIDASGHWGCLLCFLSVWLKFRTWLDQNHTVSQQTSCPAGLTVHLSSVDCSVDRFVKKKSGFLCSLLCIRCPVVDFAWGRYVYGFVNVFAPQIEAYTHHYLCYRTFPNSSDLNPMWVTALTRYWKLHTELIIDGCPLNVLLQCVYLLGQKDLAWPLQHPIYNESASQEKRRLKTYFLLKIAGQTLDKVAGLISTHVTSD